MFWEVNHSYFIFFVSELPSLNMFLSLFLLFYQFQPRCFYKVFKIFSSFLSTGKFNVLLSSNCPSYKFDSSLSADIVTFELP